MKRAIGFISILLSALLLISPAFYLSASLQMRYTAGPFNASFATPYIDGVVGYDEGWSKGTDLDVRNLGESAFLNGSGKGKYTVFTAYDNIYFYIAAEITDTTFRYTDSVEDYNPSKNKYLGLNGDLFAFSIDPLGLFNKNNFNSYDDYLPTYSFGIGENDEVYVYSAHYENTLITDEITAVANTTERGWDIEIAFPWEKIYSDTASVIDTLCAGMIEKVNERQKEIDKAIEEGRVPPRQLIDGVTPDNVAEYSENAKADILSKFTEDSYREKNALNKVLFLYEDKYYDEDSGDNVISQRYYTCPFRLKEGTPGYFSRGLSILSCGADLVMTGKKYSVPYTDIQNRWYQTSVSNLFMREYIFSSNETNFYPENNMTRADFVTWLGMLDYVDTFNYGDSNFSDVAYKKYYTAYIDWANTKGIVNGIGNGKFGPEYNIQRQQLAVILYNFSSYKGYDTSYDENAFNGYIGSDKIASWANTAMKWAVTHGVISGDASKNLNADGTASRAVVAQMLYNYMKNIAKTI